MDDGVHVPRYTENNYGGLCMNVPWKAQDEELLFDNISESLNHSIQSSSA